MSTLAVLNEAATALEGVIGNYPVHLAEFLAVDDDGNLVIPDDPAHFTLSLITATPVHEWDHVKYRDVRIQVSAWSTTEGTALAMLAAAEAALVALDYRPLPLRALGRDGAYTGAAQDYERSTA